MSNYTQTKESIEKQFNDLVVKAKKLYPNINEAIALYSNATVHTDSLRDYLNLTTQTPRETSASHVAIA